MAPKHKDGETVVSINGSWISWVHTAVAYTAFLGALIVGSWLHYHKIVENEFYGYPDEWFPSVSATIGDRYPERSVFQLFIAITSGPRFALVFLWYVMTARPGKTLPKVVLWTGLARTITCGGWTYITSTDDHNWHDIFMIAYIIFTVPWTAGCLVLSPPNPRAVKYRKIMASLFFGTLVPLVYFFIQHKVHHVRGAYTIYAFFEWALVLFDVGFDAITALDFEGFELVVKDVKGVSKGPAYRPSTSVVEYEKDKPIEAAFDGTFSWAQALDALAATYKGFTFWSMLTSLGLSIWYFPLWHMGISGEAGLVMVSISPLLLGVSPLRSTLVKNIKVLEFLSLSGLVAFVIPGPSPRLFAVSAGVFFSCLSQAARWHALRGNASGLQASITAWMLGLIASSLAKFACYSNNPIWPIMHAENGGWNYIGLAFAVLAILRSPRVPLGSLNTPAGGKSSPFLAALGFAGLTFALHTLLSDSSTIIMWVWEGFPVRGPLAVPHGAYTLVAMGAGLGIGLIYTDCLKQWRFFAVGSAGAVLLTFTSNWLGYYGGLILTGYLTAVSPVIIATAARNSPGISFGFGFLFYNIMVLAHIWTVAYAFVPGGPLLRERTDLIMAAMMALIGAGLYASQDAASVLARKREHYSALARNFRSHFLYLLVVLEFLAIAVAYMRFPSYNYKPHHPEEKVVTVGIWTIHFSLDNDMWSSERRMRDLIRDAELDVFGLLESDQQRIIMGNRDSTQFLAEDLGYYVDAGPGPNKHTWGCALLSKFPILNSTHHLLPSPVGELAPAIHATLDMYGEHVDVVVFHSGQEEDPEDRRLQSEYLSKLMADSPRPLILMSYLVTKPHQGNYNTYVGEKSTMLDIDPTDDDRWCEYILYKGLKRTGYARISRSTITDTELQVGKFVVGEPASGNVEIDEEHVPEGRRFPAIFKGQGVRGHAFHVFNRPKYYF